MNLIWFICFNIFVIQVFAKQVGKPEFCISEACNKTSAYLGIDALQNAKVDPCENFGEYVREGWEQSRPNPTMFDIMNTVYERTLDLLSENSTDDANITKVTKKVFKSCLESEKNHFQSWNDIVDYLRSLGSSPFIDGLSWNRDKFSLKKIFQSEPKLALKVFFNREVQKCSIMTNRSSICLRDIGFDLFGLTNYERFLNEFFDLETLKHVEMIARINETAASLKEFDRHRGKFIPFFEKPKTEIVLSELSTLLDIDWVETLNAVRLDYKEVKSDDIIAIEHFVGGKNLLDFTNQADISSLADRFTVHFIYEYRSIFGKSIFNEMFSALDPNHQIFSLLTEMPLFFPVLSSLYNRKYFNPEVREEIKLQVQQAAHQFALNEQLPEAEKSRLMSKLKSLEIHDGYTELGWSKQEVIDDIFKNIDITGDESEFTRIRKQKSLNFNFNFSYGYDQNENILTIPSFIMSHSSWFDKSRPRFFTAATFNVEILNLLSLNPPNDSVAIEYKNYVDWLDDGNQDLNLFTGKLTNQQLFWITRGMEVVARSEKYGIPQNGKSLHLFFLKNEGFQDAFDCQLTEAEKAKLSQINYEMDEKLNVASEVLNFIVFHNRTVKDFL